MMASENLTDEVVTQKKEKPGESISVMTHATISMVFYVTPRLAEGTNLNEHFPVESPILVRI